MSNIQQSEFAESAERSDSRSAATGGDGGGLVLVRSTPIRAITTERAHPGCQLQCRLEGTGRAPAPGCLSRAAASPTPSAIRATRPRAAESAAA